MPLRPPHTALHNLNETTIFHFAWNDFIIISMLINCLLMLGCVEEHSVVTPTEHLKKEPYGFTCFSTAIMKKFCKRISFRFE